MPLLAASAAIAFFASFVVKLLVDRFLLTRVSVLGSFAGFEYSTNPGVAFGIRFPGGVQEILVFAALCIVGFFAWKTSKTRLQRIAFGMILGGALENIVDRMRDGVVTDFVQVGSFPIFNVADSCITIGVFLLFIEVLLQHRRVR